VVEQELELQEDQQGDLMLKRELKALALGEVTVAVEQKDL
jgi:hypothetical protein